MTKIFSLILYSTLVFVSCNSENINSDAENQSKKITSYYSGNIGEYGIIMKLDFKGNEPVSGSYYYLSQCKLIELSGMKKENDLFVFDEKSENGKKSGKISLQLKNENETAEGKWIGLTGNQELKLTAYAFEPRKDKYEIKSSRHNYSQPNEYGYGFSTTNIDLMDSSGKKADGMLIHHKMYDHTWEEWQQMMKEAENSDEMYQGLSHFWDTVYTDFYDLLSVYSTTCEIAAREHCNEHYELFDAQENRFLSGDDFLRKENFNEFEKLFIKKVNSLIDEMIKELNEEKINTLNQDELGYDIDMVIENLGYSRDNKKIEEWNTKSMELHEDKVVFIYDYGLYFMPVELYIPEDRVEFSIKEIAPFLKPEGPLNFLLTGVFEKNKE